MATSKWLKVDASAGDAYVFKNPAFLPGPGGTVRIEFDMVVPAATLAALTTAGYDFTSQWIEIVSSSAATDGLFGDNGPSWLFDADRGHVASPAAIATDIIIHITLVAAYASALNWNTRWDADGNDIRNILGGEFGDPATDSIVEIDFGALFNPSGVGVPGEIYYFDNFVLKDGDGTVIFADDFEDGTLDAWDTVTGDATVVDFDPAGGGGPVAPDNTDCTSAQSLVGCGGTVVYDNRAWAGTWPVGGDPLFNSPDVAEGGGAPGFYRWTNTTGRLILFSVRVVEPDDHPVDYNLGLNVAADCDSLTFVDDASDSEFIARERGNWSGDFTADDFGPGTPTTFDIIVAPGHTAFLEVDSWTGDTSEPPTADTDHRGKIKFEWAALEFTSYDTTQSPFHGLDADVTTLLQDHLGVETDRAGFPFATLIHDGYLYMIWGENQIGPPGGNKVVAASCALDGSGFVQQELGIWDLDLRDPVLMSDGSDVFVGFGYKAGTVPNPNYNDSCGAHDPVFLCNECDDLAFLNRYDVFRYSGGGTWDLLYSIGGGGADPAFATFVPDMNGHVTVVNDSSISTFDVRGFASASVPGKVVVHAAYTVVQCDQSLHANDFPITESPGGSLWCTNDRIYVTEFVDTFEIDVASADPVGGGGWALIERQTNDLGEIQHWTSDNPAINPAFGVWQTWADGDLVTDSTTPRDSILYGGFDCKNDGGFSLIAYCRMLTVVPDPGSYDRTFSSDVTFQEIAGAAIDVWAYNDFAAGADTSTTRYCDRLNLDYIFEHPDLVEPRRAVATRWPDTPGAATVWTDLIVPDGSAAPAYIVAGDAGSSGNFDAWVLPDTLKDGNRQWWSQVDTPADDTFDHYDYCDSPGWRQTWNGFTGPDDLGADYSISPRSAYDPINEDFYFLVANSQLRKAHVLRDYFICEPGEPCVVGAIAGLRHHRQRLGAV